MWNYNKITKSLITNGYYEFKDYLSKRELIIVKKTLLQTLDYIKPSKQKLFFLEGQRFMSMTMLMIEY